jgi:hypothetical protein
LNDYQKIWRDVCDIPCCALVTTGRTGSDFFQSTMDGHPEVFVFNGALFFHTFWQAAISVNHAENPDLSDILDEFIGNHIKAFRSRYEPLERKDKLGDGRNKSIDINTADFKAHVEGLLQGQPVTSKNVMIAIYVAYDLCLGKDISNKKLLFHHVHHVRKIGPYMADFPENKIICMTRDPRALYVSGVENWRRISALADTPSYPQYILWRAVDEALPLQEFNDGRLRILKLEDLEGGEILETICQWLGINYDPCLRDSTWAGLRWWGDELSQNQIPENERGFSKTMATNNWSRRMSYLDNYILNYLLIDILDWYGYPGKRQTGLVHALVAALVILLPMKYERRYLSPGYQIGNLVDGNIRKFLAAFYHPLRRMRWFYQLYYRKNYGKFTTFPYFSVAGAGGSGNSTGKI